MKTIKNTLRCLAALTAIAIGLTGVPTYAEVTGFEIASRVPILDGRAFGGSGGYERLEGTLYFAIDPGNPRNRVIADLALAPRNSDGLVEMSADLSILTPVDRARGNGIALVDIANRGRKVALGFNRGEGDAEFGDGFLMERGYTIVWVGWG